MNSKGESGWVLPLGNTSSHWETDFKRCSEQICKNASSQQGGEKQHEAFLFAGPDSSCTETEGREQSFGKGPKRESALVIAAKHGTENMHSLSCLPASRLSWFQPAGFNSALGKKGNKKPKGYDWNCRTRLCAMWLKSRSSEKLLMKELEWAEKRTLMRRLESENLNSEWSMDWQKSIHFLYFSLRLVFYLLKAEIDFKEWIKRLYI